MMRRGVGILVTVLALWGAESAAVDVESRAAVFRDASARNPDDPDLAWGLALALRDRGELDAALAELRRVARRWPHLRTDAAFEAGRIESERQRPHAALVHFETAIELDPFHGPARLHRALALRELGRDGDAERELRVLESVVPELRSEALLLRGLQHRNRGELASSRSLLEEVASLEPESEPARLAREILGQLPDGSAEEPRVVSWLSFGGEHDSNTTLDSGTVPSSDESDARLLLTLGLAGHVWRSDWGVLTLGYSLDETRHDELQRYDQRSHTLFGTLVTVAPFGQQAILEVTLMDGHLDDDRYQRSWRLRPAYALSFSEGRRTLQLYGDIEKRAYHEPAAIAALGQDGLRSRVGAEGRFPIPGWHGGLGLVDLHVGRTDTDTGSDLLGFSGDFDNRTLEIRGVARLPIGHRLELTLHARLAHERYTHHNLVHTLTDEGVGTTLPKRRRSDIQQAALSLGYLLDGQRRVDLRWQVTRERSNVDVYDYERHVLGIHLTQRYSWP